MSTPREEMMKGENLEIFYKFSSLISLLEGKKKRIQGIFVRLMEDPELRKIICDMMGGIEEYDMMKFILIEDSSISKSKYVSRLSKNICAKSA